MSSRLTVALRVSGEVEPRAAVRAAAAFRLACATAGHEPAAADGRADIVVAYGREGDGADVLVPATYTVRAAGLPAPRPVAVQPPAGLARARLVPLPCFHPLQAGEPDLLGELFEWFSGDHERSIVARDAVGRIPISETVHGRYGLDPRIPWGTEAIRWLSTSIGVAAGRDPAEAAVIEGPLGATIVAATHDLDFLPGKPAQTAVRYVKNLGLAIAARDPGLATQVAGAALPALRGRNPLDQLERMVEREQQLDISSSVNVVSARRHPKDPNYLLGEPRTTRALDRLAAAGVEIGLHGSWSSLAEPERLAEEYALLAAGGHPPLGGRQHWLRYTGPDLFDALVRAGAVYDSTAGHAATMGFRHGLSSPFPPWDFAREEPYPFLEIPLAVMDSAATRHPLELAHETVDRGTSRTWGGFAVLWHDPVFGGTQFRRAVGDLYWALKRPGHEWVRPLDLVERCRPAYEAWGLTPVR